MGNPTFSCYSSNMLGAAIAHSSLVGHCLEIQYEAKSDELGSYRVEQRISTQFGRLFENRMKNLIQSSPYYFGELKFTR